MMENVRKLSVPYKCLNNVQALIYYMNW